MSSTKQIFEKFNRELKQKFIPEDNEPVCSPFTVDCEDPIFSESFSEIINSKK